MVMGALDLCHGYDGIFAAEELGVGPPPETTRMLRLAQEVFQECVLHCSLGIVACASSLLTRTVVHFFWAGHQRSNLDDNE